MFKRFTELTALAFVLMVFVLATLFMPINPARAASNIVAVEGVAYNVDASMADNLKALLGKQVYVTLESGKTFAGFVKAVGNHFLHLEKLAGKDYFDALIRIDNINAIDTRFREVKR